MSDFKRYRRKGIAEMRPYFVGETLHGVSISKEDIPEPGGMVSRNPDNHDDQWYVAKEYFEKNFELID
jgi:hypothetical protein